jgi:hypothetical protein
MRIKQGQSLQTVPRATPAAVLLQMLAFNQVAEALLQGVAARASELMASAIVMRPCAFELVDSGD